MVQGLVPHSCRQKGSGAVQAEHRFLWQLARAVAVVREQ